MGERSGKWGNVPGELVRGKCERIRGNLELSGKAEATQGGTLGQHGLFTEFQCILKETAMKNCALPAQPTACCVLTYAQKPRTETEEKACFRERAKEAV